MYQKNSNNQKQQLNIGQEQGYSQYRRIKLLGKGSYGDVYLCECKQDQKLWVIKQIDISKMTAQEKAQTYKEAKILSLMKHPNIVLFKEVYITQSQKMCIVMDFADGGDLEKKIQTAKEKKNNYYDESQILDWFTQLCLAVKHVHDRKIIHRDLKTQNIFLTKDNIVKLGGQIYINLQRIFIKDFGISKMLNKSIDKCKTLIGTPYYLSPEILQQIPYNQKSDIWSLGVILYELMSLKHPFDGRDVAALTVSIVRADIQPVPSFYSNELKHLVRVMLEKEPKLRPSIKQILNMHFIRKRISNFLSESIHLKEFPNQFLNQIREIAAKETKIMKNDNNQNNLETKKAFNVENICIRDYLENQRINRINQENKQNPQQNLKQLENKGNKPKLNQNIKPLSIQINKKIQQLAEKQAQDKYNFNQINIELYKQNIQQIQIAPKSNISQCQNFFPIQNLGPGKFENLQKNQLRKVEDSFSFRQKPIENQRFLEEFKFQREQYSHLLMKQQQIQKFSKVYGGRKGAITPNNLEIQGNRKLLLNNFVVANQEVKKQVHESNRIVPPSIHQQEQQIVKQFNKLQLKNEKNDQQQLFQHIIVQEKENIRYDQIKKQREKVKEKYLVKRKEQMEKFKSQRDSERQLMKNDIQQKRQQLKNQNNVQQIQWMGIRQQSQPSLEKSQKWLEPDAKDNDSQKKNTLQSQYSISTNNCEMQGQKQTEVIIVNEEEKAITLENDIIEEKIFQIDDKSQKCESDLLEMMTELQSLVNNNEQQKDKSYIHSQLKITIKKKQEDQEEDNFDNYQYFSACQSSSKNKNNKFDDMENYQINKDDSDIPITKNILKMGVEELITQTQINLLQEILEAKFQKNDAQKVLFTDQQDFANLNFNGNNEYNELLYTYGLIYQEQKRSDLYQQQIQIKY